MILQLLEDWRRERRIRRLAELLRRAQCDGKRGLARAYWLDMKRECEGRSVRQVKRMEREGGIA
ncbi:hypothetical protein [Xanthomonas vasicola]|uniref:hypothetical protein n=1 Tax=Xanthomonas vasicola TaxID=56459 RepID=UPI00053114DA|nr:hypothetical protein [Xanthomonas vasicola]AZR23509.1 hypothetical protein NX81_015760 [Xanthomonas vasicola]KGR44454.1 hypothetical protein NX04_06935 [Xanthomonas vasicola]TWQ40724.1 hypothetical protein FQJ96_06120 [Xanthomonas vasicola]TWQ61119.1 hypothetical protein FQJ93_03945 [Xanthomonas vasicola]TWQ71407.1 hypothetical protein FQJ89_22210 [Xanthomonas vasicola]